MHGWAIGLCAALSVSVAARADITGDAIRIGVLTDMSGPFATAMGPGSVAAAQMAAEEFGGAIDGKPIIILRADHQNKPDIGASIARQWFDRDGVSAIADGGTSAVALAVENLVRQNHKIALISGGGAEEISNQACAPTAIQWAQDSYSTVTGLVSAVAADNKAPWFFITGDYAYGKASEAAARARLAKLGVTVAGSVTTPIGTSDFSAPLLQAQASGAKILALNAAADNASILKQAVEFGLQKQGMTVIPVSFQNVDIKAVGLETAQGDLVVTSFFEDASPAARAFSDRFYARMHAMPSQIQAGVYSSVLHYLQAVKDTHSTDGDTVFAKMKATPVNDAYARNGRMRDDGRMVRELYLVQVKTPAESKGEWDLVKLVRTIPVDQAFRPLGESKCPLVREDSK
jgi:ABC-type branched-subunit amino acid transport system substrate-binding protein